MNYKEVYEKVKEALNNKTPFLVLRLGDGEYLTMSKKNIKYVCTRQFNYLPEAKDLDKIAELVKNAYTNADIIGIPTTFHVEKCGSGWANAYPYLTQVNPKTQTIPTCSIDIHSELLHSGLLNKILKAQDSLVYISGRNLDKGFKTAFNINNIESFIVNAEQKFEKRKSENHWPFQYEMVLDWINRTDIKGKLCLCGAGVLGKHYAHLLKRNGGIVLDIGSVFDSWAGKVTRGKGRGVDSIDNTYKL